MQVYVFSYLIKFSSVSCKASVDVVMGEAKLNARSAFRQ